jgi:hypothetical protein
MITHTRKSQHEQLGDNEWNDCPNRNAAWGYWIDTFQGFESRYWNHTFQIERMDDRPETFAFVHKGTLFIGLNLVGGVSFNDNEWSTRLSTQASWTMDLIRRHVNTTTVNSNAFGSVPSMPIVIFGHVNPLNQHDAFFAPMQAFIRDELADDIPILYLSKCAGDGSVCVCCGRYLCWSVTRIEVHLFMQNDLSSY